MKDLCAETGLSRQAIHFYIQEGLLPEGAKTGRNMAWYGPRHVERLRLIRRLQEERLLPLKAIRALLEGDTGGLPEAQRNLMSEVANQLPAAVVATPPPLRMSDALARHRVDPDELERMIELGFITVRGGAGAARGRASESGEADVRELGGEATRLGELWDRGRTLGFTRERGFGVDDLVPFFGAAQDLVAHETQLLLERLAHLPPAEVAPMIERALPVAHATFIHFHAAAVRRVFTAAKKE
jgi:DNA-binding transcriptional MerR regulator